MARRWGRFPAALLTAGLLALTAARAEIAVPPPAARVIDLTGTLSGATVARIEAKLAALESRQGDRLAVLMVPSTGTEDLAQFGTRVAAAWGRGRPGGAAGAILVIAKDDRRVRIEIGPGLAGTLPQASASRIVTETVTPYFRAGDYDGGVESGVDRMIAVVDGEPLPAPVGRWNRGPGWQFLYPLLFALVFAASGVLQALCGRLVGSLVIGGLAGAIAGASSQALPIGIASGLVAFGVAIAHGAMRDGRAAGDGGVFSGGGASGRW